MLRGRGGRRGQQRAGGQQRVQHVEQLALQLLRHQRRARRAGGQQLEQRVVGAQRQLRHARALLRQRHLRATPGRAATARSVRARVLHGGNQHGRAPAAAGGERWRAPRGASRAVATRWGGKGGRPGRRRRRRRGLTSCSACAMSPPVLSMASRCGLEAYESAMLDSAMQAFSTTLASCYPRTCTHTHTCCAASLSQTRSLTPSRCFPLPAAPPPRSALAHPRSPTHALRPRPPKEHHQCDLPSPANAPPATSCAAAAAAAPAPGTAAGL